MPNIRIISTMYLTSRKNRFADDKSNPKPAVKRIKNSTSTGNQSRYTLMPTLAKTRTIAKVTVAIKKSKRQANVEAKGKTSRGKYILVTNSLLPTRLCTANLIALIKKVQGKTLTDTETTPLKSKGFPETREIAVLIKMPAATAMIGIKSAHKKPITDCLYLTLISRRVSINNRSRYFKISLNINLAGLAFSTQGEFS